MARHHRRQSAAAAPPTPGPTDPPSRTPGIGGVELIALALILLTAINSWLVRHANNPDGVSYLDLARRLSAGDGAAFVQGYWSPLYPALISLLSALTGEAPATLLVVAHLINGTAVIGAILFLWWWGRKEGGPLFTRAALAALFLASRGFPRIEAVTPDVLLLALMTWLGYELLVERGARWGRTGLLFGLTYLVKTSAWPWLLLSIPLRLWGARDAEGRRAVLLSVPVTLAVMLLWVVPLSAKAGHPTFGSAGRLNYCWYIESCDSRTPDEHRGGHVAYREVAVDSSRSITFAEFEPGAWTYAPWSDPTAWEAGVLSRRSTPPTPAMLVRYWGRIGWHTLSLWLLPVLAGVLLPWSLFEWRSERRRWWTGEGRPALVVALLGGAGILQFILIHAEHRLIAPYLMLLALAVLQGSLQNGAAAASPALSLARRGAGWLGLVLVAGFAYVKVNEAVDAGVEWDKNIEVMAGINSGWADIRVSPERIVVIGPAIPAMAAAFVAGSRIVAQIPPGSAELWAELPPAERGALLTRLFGGRAEVAWRTATDGTLNFLRIAPP